MNSHEIPIRLARLLGSASFKVICAPEVASPGVIKDKGKRIKEKVR